MRQDRSVGNDRELDEDDRASKFELFDSNLALVSGYHTICDREPESRSALAQPGREEGFEGALDVRFGNASFVVDNGDFRQTSCRRSAATTPRTPCSRDSIAFRIKFTRTCSISVEFINTGSHFSSMTSSSVPCRSAT